MSKLKIKFSVYEKRLAMQVIEQASDITGTTNKPIDFKASNGIVISSKSKPGVYPSLNELALRGDNQSADLDIVYGKFESTKDAIDFANKSSEAIQELFNEISEKELIKLTTQSGKEIRFKNCSILFTKVQGSVIVQILKSDFKSINAINSSNFNVELNGASIKSVSLPYKTETPVIGMINVSDLSDDDIKNVLVDLFKLLSETEVSGDLRSINSDLDYPDFIFESI